MVVPELRRQRNHLELAIDGMGPQVGAARPVTTSGPVGKRLELPIPESTATLITGQQQRVRAAKPVLPAGNWLFLSE